MLEYVVSSFKCLNNKIFVIQADPLSSRLEYKAGQYVEIFISSTESSFFSIANAPNEKNTLEFHISSSPRNTFKNKLLNHIKDNKRIFIQGPYGNATLAMNSSNIICLLTDVGFSPIKAIIEEIKIKNIIVNLTIFWRAQHSSDIYINLLDKCFLRDNNFSLFPIIKNDYSSYLVEVMNHLNKSNIKNSIVYAVDSNENVKSAYKELVYFGLPKNRFKSDTLNN